MATPGHVLVIGATGILGPAAQTLLERGKPVVAVARDAAALTAMAQATDGDLTVQAVDAQDAPALARALAGLRLSGAIAYDPAVSDESWTVLARLVDGPVVRVVTSSAADPSRSELPTQQYPFMRLVLGWTDDCRWHTPAEVSAAAVALLDQAEVETPRPEQTPSGDGAVLGRVRPWSQRPV